MNLMNIKKFEVLDLFNVSSGLVLLGNSQEHLTIGDVINANDTLYEIVKFVVPSGPPRDDISIEVKRIEDNRP